MSREIESSKGSRWRWKTVSVVEDAQSYTVSENRGNDALHRSTEAILVFVAILVLVAGYVQLLLPHTILAFGSTASHFGASAVMIAVSLVLYAFATRGQTPVVEIDKDSHDIWVGRLNSLSQSRVRTHYPSAKVRSLFVRRTKGTRQDAVLFARISGKVAPVRLLRGASAEVEAVHRDLCAISAPEAPRMQSEPPSPRRVKPRLIAVEGR